MSTTSMVAQAFGLDSNPYKGRHTSCSLQVDPFKGRPFVRRHHTFKGSTLTFLRPLQGGRCQHTFKGSTLNVLRLGSSLLVDPLDGRPSGTSQQHLKGSPHTNPPSSRPLEGLAFWELSSRF
eukprot:2343663-Pleurochrysis_carterae.AAC.1